MRWLAMLAVVLAVGCGDDDDAATIDAAVFDAAAGQTDAPRAVDAGGVDALIDRDAHSADCLPSGDCGGGPACGPICCDVGERCVAGECKCGGADACGAGDVCTSGPQPKDGCGSVCCGASQPCPP